MDILYICAHMALVLSIIWILCLPFALYSAIMQMVRERLDAQARDKEVDHVA